VYARTDTIQNVYLRVTPPSHGQVFGGTFPHKFPGGSSRSALPCEPQRSHVCYFTDKSVIFECREAQATRNSHDRALSPAQYHHIGLYSPTCNSKHETGGPAWTAAVAHRDTFSCTETLQVCSCLKTAQTGNSESQVTVPHIWARLKISTSISAEGRQNFVRRTNVRRVTPAIYCV